MNELAPGKMETLREDGEFTIARITRPGSLPSRLVISAVQEQPGAASLAKLENAYALRDELQGAWLVRPMEWLPAAGGPALAVEDPGGQFLDELLAAPMAIGAFLRMAIGLTRALGSLHARGLVHKDVKPANFIVKAETSEAWLTGFGATTRLTRHRQAAGQPEIMAGTLAYMAPEQTGRMNRSIDARSDLYALGVTFYEMLVGSLPFIARDSMEWVHCHIARLPAAPSRRRGDLPETLSALIMKLLSKAPEERYLTAAGVEADLRRALNAWEALGRIEPFPLGSRDVSDQLLIPEILYGRESEMELLLAAFERVVQHGATELVLVSGYSGVGKSSVVNELHRWLVPPRGIFASGKFDQFKRDIPYATLAQAFQKLVRQILVQSDAEVAQWRDALGEALGSNGQLMVNLIPELEIILGTQPAVAELAPQDAQNRFQMVFRRFLGVFAQPEHPLALFLDDLQWLDAATLQLLKHLVQHDGVRHVLLIGAYRDNEVSASHPLMRTVGEIRESGAPVHHIALATLGLGDVVRLLTDTLRAEPEQVRALAELVHEKTGGNPFFVGQFVAELADEGLLAFEREAGAWKWDLSRLQAKGYTDNVVELMVTKLSRLPGGTQESLQNLACLGNSAEIAQLGMVCERPAEALHSTLWEALRLGLISRTDEAYAFAHDRVQEAAYGLIPGESRSAKHLHIGRLLSSRETGEGLEERVFQIVNHFNRGADLVIETAEREKLLKLNLIAGRKAKAAIAHASAGSYLRRAVELLPAGAWERQYERTFELYLDFSECEYLVGNFAAADELFDLILSRSRSDLDRARVFSLRMRLYVVAGKYDDGVGIALTALRLFGVYFPDDESAIQAAIAAEFREVPVNLGPRAIGDLLDAPVATDPKLRAIINLLVDATPCSYIGRPKLFPLIALRAVNSSLRFGNTDQSSYAYGIYALMLVSVAGDIQAGFQFSEMSLRLNDKFNNPRLRGTLLHLYGDHINFWRRPFATGLPVLAEAFLACLEVGDLVYAGFLAFETVWQVIENGDHLDQVLTSVAKSSDFARQSNNEPILQTIRLEQQFVASLQGKTSSLLAMDENGFDEAACLGSIVKATFGCGIFFYYAMKQILAFLAGRYDESLAFALEAEPTLGAAMGMPIEATYHFFFALAMTALFPIRPAEQQAADRNTLAAKLQKLRLWAENCPENFHHRYALVSAEVARIEGRRCEAMRGYDEAIRSARASGAVHYEALAQELAALYYLAEGFETIAETYLRNARQSYARWGAQGKVRQLDQRYPRLRETTFRPNADGGLNASAEQLDAESVVKASQALSMEIVLPKLIEKLMQIAVEHAGAERGLLILLRGEEPQVEAEATTSSQAVTVSFHAGPAGAASFPESIARYVIRTHESVILDDAGTPNPFSTDPYLQAGRSRSVLCLPLVKQARLIGVLYLENRLASHVFTAARIAVLQLLASQAAISLENARLYAASAEALGRVKSSEEELRTLIEAVPTQVWCAMPDGFTPFQNQRWLDYSGLTAEQAQGWGWRDAVHPHDAERYLGEWQAIKASQKPGEAEVRFRRHDGEYRWFLMRVVPVRDEQGHVVKWYGTNTDIEDLKHAEALVAAEKRLLEMIATGHSLAAILDTLCRMVEELNGGAPTSILLLEVDSQRLRYGVAPSLPASYVKATEGILVGACAGSCGTAAYRKERVFVADIATDPLWQDYRALALEHGLRACWSTPILSSEGVVLGTIASYAREARQIMPREVKIIAQFTHLASIAIERKRAEDALAKSEAFLAEAQKISHTGSWTWNLSTDRVVWSAEHCRIFGYKVDEAGGTFAAILDRMLPEDRTALYDPVMEAARRREDFTVDYRIVLPDGSIRYVQSVGCGVANEAGETVEYIGTTADVTERKRAEEELWRSEGDLRKAQAELAHVTRVTTMGELAASIAHEINQPIAGVVLNGNASLRWLTRVQEDSAYVKEARAAIERIVRDGSRAGEVITRIRALFRKADSVKDAIDVNQMIQEVIVLARGEIEKRRVTLTLELAADLPQVPGDRVQLQQVMLNLILNGIEAMATVEGRLWELIIQTRLHEGSHVLVTVRDSGIGVDALNVEQIFAAFHTTKSGGLGMGLSISRTIVESHGGRLWAKPNDGPGMTFQFTLPAASGPVGQSCSS